MGHDFGVAWLTRGESAQTGSQILVADLRAFASLEDLFKDGTTSDRSLYSKPPKKLEASLRTMTVVLGVPIYYSS